MTFSSPKTLLILAGTRPEVIKMAPVVQEARRRHGVQAVLCVTAQHRELLDDALNIFALRADYDLNLMKENQSLAQLTAGLFSKLPKVLREVAPDIVLVQGDTTTAFAGAVAAFYAGVPVGHVEAGLRTGDLLAPFPEEGNRRMVSQIARWHFSPTDRAAKNLLREGINGENIHVTGNTVIDALLSVSTRVEPSVAPGRYILVTCHRRENFGPGMVSVCEALREIATQNPAVRLIYPVHPNPHVREVVEKRLSGVPNVDLIAPLSYEAFVAHLKGCAFVITDSGGIQEEAPALGKPVLITRNVTERPEAVDAGCALLVGTDKDRIVNCATELLTEGPLFQQMSQAKNPFGNGHAAVQILDLLA